MTDSAILSFYRRTGTDHAGRKFDEIISWDNRRLEMVHDHIQWLFPLPEPSRFNPEAPLLSPVDIGEFRADPSLRARVLAALDLMLGFLGFTRASGNITRAANFSERSTNWLDAANHNHSRLTRILLFLGHTGLIDEAVSLLACLEDVAAREGREVISSRTLSFWRDAVKSRR